LLAKKLILLSSSSYCFPLIFVWFSSSIVNIEKQLLFGCFTRLVCFLQYSLLSCLDTRK